MRRIIVIASGVVVLLLIGVGVLINNLVRPAYLDILVAPIDAKITINGTEYRNATYEMEPGEYVAEIAREGYFVKNIEVKVEKGRTTGLYAYLNPENEDYASYEAEQNSESLEVLLKLNGYDAAGQRIESGVRLIDGDTAANEFVKKVTIAAKMPIYTSVCGTPARRTNCNAVVVNYDYDVRCGSRLCLIIAGRESQLSGEALEAVKAEIEATGRRFDEYQYIYSQNTRM